VNDPNHDFERFWAEHLARMKKAAELKAKNLAARNRTGSNHKPHSKEKHHDR
jgi:hypothetical protein